MVDEAHTVPTCSDTAVTFRAAALINNRSASLDPAEALQKASVRLRSQGLLARYEAVFGRQMDSDYFRTRDGGRITLRKRLALIVDIHGVSEDAMQLKKRKRTFGKQLAVASGLRQVGNISIGVTLRVYIDSPSVGGVS